MQTENCMASSRTFWYLLIAAAVLLFIRLGATTVFQVAEGRNAQCAAEMLAGDGIVPMFNGKLRTDKPPVHYYMMMLAYSVAGKSEGASRFFSAIAGIIIVLGTWWITRRHFSTKAATISALVLLSSVHFLFQFRLATPDPFLILAHVFALFSFWEGYATKNKRWYYAMYAMMGLAVFAKGPVGLALPGSTIFFFLLFRRELNWKTIVSLQPLIGIFIFALVALPWYWLVHEATDGAWTRGFFFEHNVSRFNAAVDGHKGPFFLPLVFVLAGLFPFSVFMPMASIDAWKKKVVVPFLFFMLLSTIFIIVPYSFSSTKLINYTSPAYPFVAILIGAYLSTLRMPKALNIQLLILGIITLLFPIGFVIWVKNDKLPELLPQIWMVFILPMAAVGAWFLYRQKKSEQWWLWLAGGSMLFNMLFFAWLFPLLDQTGSVKKLSGVVRDAPDMVAYKRMNDAFVYYHQKSIPVLPAVAEVKQVLDQHPKTLVLQLGKIPDLKDSIPELTLIHDEKDLFSSQHTFIYQKK